jgi:drug/metabolite transporter (DMT)-like permease
MAKGALLAAVAAVLFGVTTPVIQKAGVGAGPFATAMLLYTGAAFASVPRAKGASEREMPVRRRDAARILAVAFLGSVVAPTCFVWGLQHTSSTSASLLLNFEAAFTVFLGWRLYGEWIAPRVVGAVVLMVLGGVVLVIANAGAGTGVGWGSVAVVLATLGWALDNALTRPLADLAPERVVGAKGAIGAFLCLGASIGRRETFPSAGHVAELLICGAIGYGLSLRLYLLAQRRIGAGRTGSIFALAPFVGAAVAWTVGERTNGLPTLGAAMLFGLALYLHATEKHEHGHTHARALHEHAHRHDDGHHDHPHDPTVVGGHSHSHAHDERTHEHAHGSDLHHGHRHESLS